MYWDGCLCFFSESHEKARAQQETSEEYGVIYLLIASLAGLIGTLIVFWTFRNRNSKSNAKLPLESVHPQTTSTSVDQVRAVSARTPVPAGVLPDIRVVATENEANRPDPPAHSTSPVEPYAEAQVPVSPLKILANESSRLSLADESQKPDTKTPELTLAKEPTRKPAVESEREPESQLVIAIQQAPSNDTVSTPQSDIATDKDSPLEVIQDSHASAVPAFAQSRVPEHEGLSVEVDDSNTPATPSSGSALNVSPVVLSTNILPRDPDLAGTLVELGSLHSEVTTDLSLRSVAPVSEPEDRIGSDAEASRATPQADIGPEEASVLGSSEPTSQEPPRRIRSPRQYRPLPRVPVRATTSSGLATSRSKVQATRDRALPIEVRLVFEKAGFCRVTMLPRRNEDLPVELAISGTGCPAELVALQDGWYQDIALLNAGALLRTGIEWESFPSEGPTVRWSLAGREIYVLSPHNDLNGFVSTTRLILGEQHVVLCIEERLEEVLRAIEATGSPKPDLLEGVSGIPSGWFGLRGVTPVTPVSTSLDTNILDALRPLADVEIVLEGGVRIERSTWLTGYPPRIRLRGDIASAGTLSIDGQEATQVDAGRYVAPGWDTQGQHTVWCTSASRNYGIRDGLEHWEPWESYAWSMGDFPPDSEQKCAAICGVVVRPPRGAPKESRAVVVPASNTVLLGAVPGEIQACIDRSDLRAEICTGFPWFDPVWAIPADAMQCDKRIARIHLTGAPQPVNEPKRQPRAVGPERAPRTAREHRKRVEAWCTAILTAGRKGLLTEPAGDEISELWRTYKGCAKSIWRGLR